MTDAVLLRARGAGRRYRRRQALRAVDLDVRGGESVALLGPNGAGKTTLLEVLAGAATPSEGAVERPPERDTGWVPQRAALHGRLTPRENLRLFARLEGLADAEAEAERLLGAVDLLEAADRPAATLSVGNAQRLNVAIGLLGAPSLVFLDEPTASLDPRQRRRLWSLLADVPARGGAVVFATQNVEEAHLHATRVVVLIEGAVVFDGPQAAFWERAGLEPGAGAFEAAFVAFLERTEASA